MSYDINLTRCAATVAAIFLTSFSWSAGSLEPDSAPAPVMHSLDEIYQEVASLGTITPEIPETSIHGTSTGINAIIRGKTTGDIEGNCTIEGREDTITVIGMEHQLSVPINDDGSPGTVENHPISIFKYLDKASPLLWQATFNKEKLDITLRFYQKDGSGTETNYYIITLEDAYICDAVSVSATIEKFSFKYDKVSFTDKPSGLESEINWNN